MSRNYHLSCTSSFDSLTHTLNPIQVRLHNNPPQKLSIWRAILKQRYITCTQNTIRNKNARYTAPGKTMTTHETSTIWTRWQPLDVLYPSAITTTAVCPSNRERKHKAANSHTVLHHRYHHDTRPGLPSVGWTGIHAPQRGSEHHRQALTTDTVTNISCTTAPQHHGHQRHKCKTTQCRIRSVTRWINASVSIEPLNHNNRNEIELIVHWQVDWCGFHVNQKTCKKQPSLNKHSNDTYYDNESLSACLQQARSCDKCAMRETLATKFCHEGRWDWSVINTDRIESPVISVHFRQNHSLTKVGRNPE